LNRVHFFHLSVVTLTLINSIALMNIAAPSSSNPYYPSTLASIGWKGDNQDFAEARKLIDQETTGGQAPEALVTRYKTVIKDDPMNPLVLFRWAYALRKAALASNPFSTKKALEALEAMNRNGKPHPYDYVRLQFLLASDLWPSVALKPLGRRLLQYNPDDQVVLFQLVVDLKNSMLPGDINEALALAKKMVQQDPKSARNHALLAGAYDSVANYTKQQSFANKAVAEYQLYLKLAPPNANFRAGAEQMIRAIKDTQFSVK
jgi:tetratricopeptide (TPR) repeat protein